MHHIFRKAVLVPLLALVVLFHAAPALAAALPETFSHTSTNWAGYAARGAKFTAAGGTWTVPTTLPSAADSAETTWVGVGGLGTKDLIQVGTVGMSREGHVIYQAWYEILPALSTYIPVLIRPGDTITAAVIHTGGTGWNISLRNVTTGQGWSTDLSYTSSFSSAEWITEMPMSASGQYIPLSDFGATTFSNAWTIRNGSFQSISTAGAKPLSMVTKKGAVLAKTSTVSAGGSFTVSRTLARAGTTAKAKMPVAATALASFP